jgi:hypothetical protein
VVREKRFNIKVESIRIKTAYHRASEVADIAGIVRKQNDQDGVSLPRGKRLKQQEAGNGR